MHATVTDAGENYITIGDLSITDVNELNMPTSGQIFTNNQYYKYDGFTFDTDEKGKIVSMTFNLTEPIGVDRANSLRYKSFQIGDDVDYMGIPYYQNQMNLFLRNFCEQFNLIEESGVDLDGEQMGAFFIAKDKIDSQVEHEMMTALTKDNNGTAEGVQGLTHKSETYYQLTAGNVSIAKETDKDARKFATTDAENYTSGVDAAHLIPKLQALQSKTTLFRGGKGDAFLQCIYADVTVDSQECKIFTTNFENIQKSIKEQRMSVSGVDEDEEALDLIKFQNAYNLASKCISVFSEIYDRLILNTGV
jgi:flagellar hook-associated protein 1 FlgK